MENILSSKIKIYPSSRRNDIFDRNARLNSEQNLVSVINRLTGVDSFVIDGLNVSTSTASTITLSSGSCNIYGYYFKLGDEETNAFTLNISDLKESALANNDVLCARIEVKHEVVSGQPDFYELVGNDTTSSVATSKYSGFSLLISTPTQDNNKKAPWFENTSNSSVYYYLPIAQYISNNWINIPTKNLKYTSSDIKVNVLDGLTKDITGYQSLQNWLDNLIIDDGDLDSLI